MSSYENLTASGKVNFLCQGEYLEDDTERNLEFAAEVISSAVRLYEGVNLDVNVKSEDIAMKSVLLLKTIYNLERDYNSEQSESP